MGLFLDVPPLDERVLDESGVNYLKAIHELNMALIVPTIARLHLKTTGKRLGKSHTKTDGSVWSQAVMLENAGFLDIETGKGSSICKLTPKAHKFLGLSENTFENI